MPSFLAASGLEAPAAISASATRSLRTICSGVCLFFIENPPFAHSGPSDSHSSRISFRGARQVDPSGPPAFILYSGYVVGVVGLVAAVGLWMLKAWSYWTTIVVCALNFLLGAPGVVFAPGVALK